VCEVDIQYDDVFTSSVRVKHRQRWKNTDSVLQPSQPKQSGIQLNPSIVAGEWFLQKKHRWTRFRITRQRRCSHTDRGPVSGAVCMIVVVQFICQRKFNELWKKEKWSLYRFGNPKRVLGIWGSQVSRQSSHVGGRVVSPTHRPPLPPRK
jgi:hypothetical protein